MATDGVKIIDGDLARDTYNQLMDLYDSNADIQTIRSELPFVKQDYGPDTDFYHEIFVTAYALALWEMGELTDDVLDEVKKVIALGAGVKVWIAECDDKEGKNVKRNWTSCYRKFPSPIQK
jgi:hypothetical protein